MTDSTPPAEHRDIYPWGPYATIGIGLLVLISFFIAPFITALLWPFVELLAGWVRLPVPTPAGRAIDHLGFFVSLTSIISALLGTTMLWVAIRLRQRRYSGQAIRHYLKLNRFSWRSMLGWTVVTIAYLGAMDAVSYSLGRSLIPDIMVEAYATAVWLPLFWFAIGLCAPFFEELYFRGFLLAGFRRTRRQTILAVGLISAAWAAIHLQYEWYEVIWIFGLGLLFGAARLQTGSLWPPILLHILCNVLATLQVAWQM